MTTAKILLIIFTLVSSNDDWPKYQKQMLEQYKQAEADGIDSSMNNFLNRILVAHCNGAKNTEADIKKTLYLVAMYHDQKCELPQAAEEFVCKYKDKLFSTVVKGIQKEGEASGTASK
jgi:hypothetical protein